MELFSDIPRRDRGMRRRHYKDFIEGLDDDKYMYLRAKADECSVSLPEYLGMLIDKDMEIRTRKLIWEKYAREDGDEFIVSQNERLILTIDWELSPWGHVIHGLYELRAYETQNQKLIHMKTFESHSAALKYAQGFAELYDLGVDG